MGMTISLISLVISSCSIVIAVLSYQHTRKKDRIEGALRLTRYFHENLRGGDISQWRQIWTGTSDSAGAKSGLFLSLNDMQLRPLSTLFEEAPPDAGAVQRMAELLNFIAQVLDSSDSEHQIIHFELGQFLLTLDDWFKQIDLWKGDDQDFYQKAFPHLKSYMAQHASKIRTAPIKSYAALEAW